MGTHDGGKKCHVTVSKYLLQLIWLHSKIEKYFLVFDILGICSHSMRLQNADYIQCGQSTYLKLIMHPTKVVFVS